MLSNKVSIKDLFSTNPGQLLGSKYDSTGNLPDSCSQLPLSQDSQDFMNTQSCSANLSQPSESPGRRFYQRYASKGPLFTKDVSQAKGQLIMMKSSYQQQLQNNKTRAKERDERDLLNSVMLTVKESAAEVKIAASAVRDVVQQGSDMTEKQLAQHLQQIQTGLSRHSEAMIKALQLRDGMKEQMAQMQEDLAAKTMHVAELEKQLDHLQQTQHQQIIDQLHNSYKDTAHHISGQLQQMYESHQGELLKQASEHQKHHQAMMQQTNRCQKQFAQQQQAVVKEIKKKMGEELHNYSEQQEMRYRHCLTEVQERMQHMQEQQKAQIRLLLQQQMTCKAGASEQTQAEMEQKQIKQLQEMQTKHKQELYHFVQQQMESTWQQQEQQVHRVIEDLWETEKEKAKYQAEQPSHTVEESYPRYESELVMLKNRYEKEVDELTARQQQQSHYCTSSVHPLVLSPFQQPKASTMPLFGWVGTIDECSQHVHHGSRDSVTRNVASGYTSTSHLISDPEHGIETSCHTTRALTTSQPFVSPLLAAKNWTSRNLFGKTNPSPIATVLPQRQIPEQNIDISNVTASQINVSELSEADRPAVKKRKRHRKSNFSGRRKKPSGHICDNGKNGEGNKKHVPGSQAITTAKTSTDPSERNSQVESVIAHTYNTKTSTMIYNFNDDQPVSPFFGYHVRNKAYGYEEPKQNEATKPDRWQSACRIKPLVNSVQTTKPFMSRMFQERSSDQFFTIGDSESSQDCYNDYSDSSPSSSPGMTITAEVFIKRRIKNEKKTPPENKRDIRNAVRGCTRNLSYLAGNDSDELDNFLASPKHRCTTSTTEPRRELRSRTAKKQSCI